ncbi:TPA: phage terminase small subunit [Escherichia coli]
MITPAQQHWQNVMAQRAGRANEGVDHAARTAHEEVLYRLRLAQARLKGVQARSAKAAIKKELLPDFSGWIEGTLEADGGQQDEVRAKLCKACAFARRGLSDADSMASSLKLLREAMHLNPNAGVKREIATLSRALKKVDSAAAPEDASTPQTQDESSKSKKTTRKPATRKTTATQKAKRG